MGNNDKKIITISREFGSGGRLIGKRLAEKLDVIVCGVDQGQDDSHNQHDHGQDQGSYRNLFAFHFHYPFPIRLCGA